MKAKFTAKKILSIMLAVLMIFSVVSISASAENNCPHISELGDEGWETVIAPTCSSSGQARKWCEKCVDWATKTIDNTPGKNHVPGVWTEVVQHTCSSKGLKEIKCTQKECGVVIKTEEVPAHDYSVVYETAATCMKDGYRFIMCTTCYDSKTETLYKSDTLHAYGEGQVTKVATCEEAGEKTYFCQNRDENGNTCKASYTESYTDEENHVKIIWDKKATVQPTCTQNGYVLGKCEVCETEFRKTLPMHSASHYEKLSTVPSTCHTRGSEYRRCICGLEYEVELDFDKDNHVYSEWRISKEPGCEPGERYRVCEYEYDIKETQAIPATGEHKYGEWVVTEESTCSFTGTRVKTCSICGDKVTEDIPVKHDLAKWTTVTKMSCNEASIQQGTKYAECDKCNYKTYFIVPAVHSFGNWRISAPADCKSGKAGTKIRECSACGKTETMEYYAEHDFYNWVVSDKPVCATDKTSGKTGMYTRVCKTCGKAEHKLIPVTHEFIDVEIITYPVCYKNGQCNSGEKLVKCKHCGKESKAAIESEHNFTEWETETAGSCNSDDKSLVEGTEKRTCKACGYVQYQSTEGKHSFTDWQLPEGTKCGDKAPENGEYRLKRTCTKCGKREEKSVSVIDHPNAITITAEATCTTTGYTVERCPDCGNENRIGEIIPVLGHDLDEQWTTKVTPSCKSSGSRYKACSRCDYLEFNEIAKTEHILLEIEAGVEPTCLTPGKTPVTYCGVCFTTFQSEAIPALGHTYAEGSEVCSRCYAYAGSDKNCGCACHSTAGMEGFFFKIIVKLYQFFGINQECSCGELHYDEPGIFAKLFGKA